MIGGSSSKSSSSIVVVAAAVVVVVAAAAAGVVGVVVVVVVVVGVRGIAPTRCRGICVIRGLRRAGRGMTIQGVVCIMIIVVTIEL